jgi:hypothetical protein
VPVCEPECGEGESSDFEAAVEPMTARTARSAGGADGTGRDGIETNASPAERRDYRTREERSSLDAVNLFFAAARPAPPPWALIELVASAAPPATERVIHPDDLRTLHREIARGGISEPQRKPRGTMLKVMDILSWGRYAG